MKKIWRCKKMVVIIHNRKIEDEIRFEVKELSEDTR